MAQRVSLNTQPGKTRAANNLFWILPTMSTQIPTFQTVSLTLRPLRETDAPILHRIYQMKGVLAYFPTTVPPPLEKVGRWIASQEKHWLEHGYGNWGITNISGPYPSMTVEDIEKLQSYNISTTGTVMPASPTDADAFTMFDPDTGDSMTVKYK